MNMFLYYAVHSFKNQLKKLFRTWVLIYFIVCMLIGGAVGLFGAAVSQHEPDTVRIEEEQEENKTESVTEHLQKVIEEEPAALVVDIDAKVELITGIVVLFVLVFMTAMGDKFGSDIFQPADVSLLFPAPLKPQSVLMFRVSLQLGGIILLTLYMMIFMPMIFLSEGYSMKTALMVVAAWGFTLCTGQFLRIAVYTAGATCHRIRKTIRFAGGVLLGIIAAGFMAFWQMHDGTILQAAAGYFNHPYTRFIPIWGWIKGIVIFSIEGNDMGAFLMCALLIFTLGIGFYLLWNFKADFYEDAISRSERTAKMLLEMKEGNTLAVQRTKKRSDKTAREGVMRGKGAAVFFYKTLYNRFRFAWLHVFTKTSAMYLAVAVIFSVIFKRSGGSAGFAAVALIIGGISFFRSLGNPLEEDIRMPYFKLAPESTWKKLICSITGGGVNTLLDLLPGMILAMIIFREPCASVAGWIVLILTLDFYSTAVGAFIGESVPVSAGLMVKQIVQIMFVYFGLLPDAGIIAAGYVNAGGMNFETSLFIAALVNVMIGIFFTVLIPLFIIPRSVHYKGAIRKMSETEKKLAKKSFSRTGLFLVVFYLTASALQAVLATVIPEKFPALLDLELTTWLMAFAPMYFVALPLGLLVLKNVPRYTLKRRNMSAGKLLLCFPAAVVLMYAGNLIGIGVSAILYKLTGIQPLNPVNDLLMNTSFVYQLLFTVILGPVVEEFIFRRCMIDRLYVYGEKRAVIVTAVLFGLFHGNISQMFYAFTLGLLFGYVYLKTGKLRYSAILHMMVNFTGGIIGPLILTIDSPVLFAGYMILLFGLIIVGIAVISIRRRTICFENAQMELEKGTRFKTVWLNAGMILFLICITFIIFSPYIV